MTQKLTITTDVNGDDEIMWSGEVAELQFTAGPDGVSISGRYKVAPPTSPAEMFERLRQLSQNDRPPLSAVPDAPQG
jgi:hypothetical protein